MADLKVQEKDLIFALDIGTRSVVGVVGKPVGDRLEVLDVEMAEHGKRAMMDGQIDDIRQVSTLARTVTERLESRLGVRLERVCVAAAGRALRTQTGSFSLELPGEQPIDAEQISRLEAGAVSVAEEALQKDGDSRRQMFLVGYTVVQYRLDNYPLANLQYHSGRKAEADVVATFLPEEVVESLYAAMRTAGLQVASMTLEPIAAMNATIPAELRLLNLAMVDIGAGTTDIALCREGSVTGYTMATVAGDEVTEAIMRAYLVDFKTAEQIKRSLGTGEEQIRCRNILGQETRVAAGDVAQVIQAPMDRLAEAIAQQILDVNGVLPSAVFLAGGGSKLSGLRERVAEKLEIDENRVAIAGNNFAMSVFSDTMELEKPEYATPLGIAISAGLGLLNDSYIVILNGHPAKLFRNGVLTLRDILLMNGYSYGDMVGKTGKSLNLTLDGRHVVLRGEPAVPAVLRINGQDVSLTTVVHAGDQIQFIPARHGASARQTLGELLGPDFNGQALVNNIQVPLGTPLNQGDVVLTLHKSPAPVPPPVAVPTMPAATIAPVHPPEATPPAAPPMSPPAVEVPVTPLVRPAQTRGLRVILNNAPLFLPAKESGQPYYLMDLLEHTDIDFDHLDRPVCLEVNGEEQSFQYKLREQDVVRISVLGAGQ
ncbi:MAG: pilus assembly protein PilM [Ruminiclostridium sp.]|jgi:cell division protein FtsA|nr:pilus assembly protein PilM [Ruminiclostridium sp.]